MHLPVRCAVALEWISQGLTTARLQFARPIHGGGEVAVKFYFEEEAYATEEALFRDGRLRGVMPAVTLISANTNVRAARSAVPLPAALARREHVTRARCVQKEHAARNGLLYPPCIVAERGEALDAWARRHRPDFPTILQILGHVAEHLAQLHAQGYAHRCAEQARSEHVLKQVIARVARDTSTTFLVLLHIAEQQRCSHIDVAAHDDFYTSE